jgi:hypothetical protein
MILKSSNSAKHADALSELASILFKATDWARWEFDTSSEKKLIVEKANVLYSICHKCDSEKGLLLSCAHYCCFQCISGSENYGCMVCHAPVSHAEFQIYNELLGSCIKCKKCGELKKLFEFYYQEMKCLCFCKACTRKALRTDKTACNHLGVFRKVTETCGRCGNEFDAADGLSLTCKHIMCVSCSQEKCLECALDS